jgi:integrase
MMLEELQRRHYSHRTAKTYVRIVRDFTEYFQSPPNKLGPEQIRQYQAYLFQVKKLTPATVSQYASALRFFFVKTLRRHFLTEHIPFPKPRRRLPSVLSHEEGAKLIDSASNLYHRTLLMTLYSTGMRRAELCRLKVTDIDSQRMMIRIQQGKGCRDPWRWPISFAHKPVASSRTIDAGFIACTARCCRRLPTVARPVWAGIATCALDAAIVPFPITAVATATAPSVRTALVINNPVVTKQSS